MRNRTYVRNKKAPVFASSFNHGSKYLSTYASVCGLSLTWDFFYFRTIPWIFGSRKSPKSLPKLQKVQIQILHEAAFSLDNPGNSPHTKITCYWWWLILSTYPLPLVQKWNFFVSGNSKNQERSSKTQIDIEYIWANCITEIIFYYFRSFSSYFRSIFKRHYLTAISPKPSFAKI